MHKYTALGKSSFINKNLKRYIKSTFQIEDQEFSKLFDKELEQVELMKGPFISIAHPFEKNKSIRNLVDEGTLSKHLLEMEPLKIDRPLYTHQVNAIEKSVAGKNIVISTGTGSGKTEAFLIPILNAISRDIEQGLENRGVQALLLYPMNALANDQRSRVREILEHFPQITFGFYTGETFEKEDKAQMEYEAENERKPLKNEIISREVLRQNTPNILFTNYSMLEYILIRPYDQTLFLEENTQNWKFIVLDEAHTYRGALGIEISYLIKRLLGNIQATPQFILTSATLASSEQDFPRVVEFARKLTSNDFDESCVIIGKRIQNKQPVGIGRYSDDDYSELVTKMRQRSISREELHRFLLSDLNYYDFVNALARASEIKQLMNRLPGWSETKISNLIDIISYINKDESLFLVDIKYHTFVRTIEGGFVTLKPKKTLHLKRISEYSIDNDPTNNIKTFELGLCEYCKCSYLVGIKRGNYFYQTDDEILYEQFSPEFNKATNILLLKDQADAEMVDMEDKVELNLCNKCGNIYDVADVNAKKCKCGSEYLIETIMYKEDKQKKSTNITTCMCCNSFRPSGVIQSFYVGRDSASSLVAQLLYKTMGKKPNSESSKKPLNPFKRIEEKAEEPKFVKQFIAFSDSRQQASFFATYFENRHIDFLRKGLFLSEIRESKKIKFKNLVEKIAYRIEKEKLFFDKHSENVHAWITGLIELLDVNRKYSLSGLGLVSFVPLIKFSDINQDILNANFENMSVDDFKSLVYFIINEMRNIPAIDYFDAAGLTQNLREEHLSYRQADFRGLTLRHSKAKSGSSLLPAKNHKNKYIDFVERAFNISEDLAAHYLENVWVYLTGNDILIKNPKKNNNNYVVKYDLFEVVDGRDVPWYQCTHCKTMTTVSINRTCPKFKCEGKLDKCDPEVVHKDNFYYAEYQTKEIEQIRIEEHTAQLDKSTGRKYQMDFKEGKINILSSSTTFEMGVDIGNLDTVYMRNVPPTPANYVQRAGRAGRRNDSAAFIVTFCSSSSHDFTYFQKPLKMIQGLINPPYFETKNQKIMERHILSVALALFFKRNSKHFESTNNFVFEGGIDDFKKYLKDYSNEIIQFIETNNIYPGFNKLFNQWVDEVFAEDSRLTMMESDLKRSIDQITLESDKRISEKKGVIYLENRKKDIKDRDPLSTLSRYNVIPKYGFPTDTVRLEIPGYDRYEMQRDLSTAISEYAPESEVLVDKKKFKSRYINLSSGYEPPQYYYKTCENCKNLNISEFEKDDVLRKCTFCENELSDQYDKFIKPIGGFISEYKEMNDKTIRPKRTYSGDTYFIGSHEIIEEQVLQQTIRLTSGKDGRLALINSNPFFVCKSCGYTQISRENRHFSAIKGKHNLPRTTIACSHENLEKYSLGHEFRTDVVIIDFLKNRFSHDEVYSMLFALLEGISDSFEIEYNDISGIISKVGERYRIVLYDSVPGGAGHVKRLLDEEQFNLALNSALEKVSFECCDESTSCYNCIRNYRNQKLHGRIKRGLAKSSLQRIKDTMILNGRSSYFIIDSGSDVRVVWNKIKSEINSYNNNQFWNQNSRLPSHAFSDLIINEISINTIFIWEDRKIALVEGLSIEEIDKDLHEDWAIYTFDEITKLESELERR